jgi:hypothetical protein
MTPMTMNHSSKFNCHPERIRLAQSGFGEGRGCVIEDSGQAGKDLNAQSGNHLNSQSSIALPSSSAFNSRLSTVDSPQ